jgi:proteasome activator subunit 4
VVFSILFAFIGIGLIYLQTYVPIVEQPEYEFSVDNLDEADREIYLFFSNKENVDKFITYFSLEEKKGKDRFSLHRFLMYKGLFNNYMDSFLPIFIEHLEKLVSTKQESLQRCGAEIIGGIVRGTKHWPFDRVEKLIVQLTPILKLAFENMMIETVGDWG